jgi:hypothetical protein
MAPFDHFTTGGACQEESQGRTCLSPYFDPTVPPNEGKIAHHWQYWYQIRTGAYKYLDQNCRKAGYMDCLHFAGSVAASFTALTCRSLTCSLVQIKEEQWYFFQIPLAPAG